MQVMLTKLRGNVLTNFLLRALLVFTRTWYFVWFALALLTNGLWLYEGIHNFSLNESFYKVLSSAPFVIECVVYILLSQILLKLFIKKEVIRNVAGKISKMFFSLFVIDLMMLLSAVSSESKRKSFLVSLLEIIPKDSFFYDYYEKSYRYIPVVFDFVKPSISGTALLIIGFVFYFIHKKIITSHLFEDSGQN